MFGWGNTTTASEPMHVNVASVPRIPASAYEEAYQEALHRQQMEEEEAAAAAAAADTRNPIQRMMGGGNRPYLAGGSTDGQLPTGLATDWHVDERKAIGVFGGQQQTPSPAPAPYPQQQSQSAYVAQHAQAVSGYQQQQQQQTAAMLAAQQQYQGAPYQQQPPPPPQGGQQWYDQGTGSYIGAQAAAPAHYTQMPQTAGGAPSTLSQLEQSAAQDYQQRRQEFYQQQQAQQAQQQQQAAALGYGVSGAPGFDVSQMEAGAQRAQMMMNNQARERNRQRLEAARSKRAAAAAALLPDQKSKSEKRREAARADFRAREQQEQAQIVQASAGAGVAYNPANPYAPGGQTPYYQQQAAGMYDPATGQQIAYPATAVAYPAPQGAYPATAVAYPSYPQDPYFNQQQQPYQQPYYQQQQAYPAYPQDSYYQQQQPQQPYYQQPPPQTIQTAHAAAQAGQGYPPPQQQQGYPSTPLPSQQPVYPSAGGGEIVAKPKHMMTNTEFVPPSQQDLAVAAMNKRTRRDAPVDPSVFGQGGVAMAHRQMAAQRQYERQAPMLQGGMDPPPRKMDKATAAEVAQRAARINQTKASAGARNFLYPSPGAMMMQQQQQPMGVY